MFSAWCLPLPTLTSGAVLALLSLASPCGGWGVFFRTSHLKKDSSLLWELADLRTLPLWGVESL